MPLDLWDYFGGSMQIQRSFVVQGLGPDGHDVQWSVGLDLGGALQSSDGTWSSQRERMNAFVSDDTIAITLSHLERPDRVVTMPRPSGHEMYLLVASSSSSLPAAPTTELAQVDTPRAIVQTEDGAYLVTASDGLFRVTTEEAINLAPTLSFDSDHYLTDLRVVGGLALVADHGRGLQVLSTTDGHRIDTVELDFYERGLAASDNQVFVGAETGLAVMDIRWSPSDPGPAREPDGDQPNDGGDDGGDDGGEPGPSDEPSGDCYWNWEWIPVGFMGYFGWVEHCE